MGAAKTTPKCAPGHGRDRGRVVEYLMPHLGKLRIRLYGFAGDVYDVLGKAGEIRRLKRLRHLGELCEILEGAHHTRWEYIVLFLHLLEAFKRGDKGLGLSAENVSKYLPLQEDISAQGVLQSVCLLANSGHLMGTFETERLVMRAVLEESSVKNRFLMELPLQARELAENILKAEQVGRFYNVLAMLYIHRCREFTGKSSLQKQALDLLVTLNTSGEKALQKLGRIYTTIRRLAYLALDLHYAPIGLSLNTHTVLLGARDFSQALLRTEESDYRDLLDALNLHLAKTVYVSPEAGWAASECERVRYPHIAKKLKNAASNGSVAQVIDNLRRDPGKYTPRPRPHYFVCRLSEPYAQVERQRMSPISLQRSIQKKCGKHVVVSMPGILPHSTDTAFVYFPEGTPERGSSSAKAFKFAIMRMAEQERVFVSRFREKEIPRFLGVREYDRYSRSVMKCALYCAFGSDYRVEIEEDGFENGFACFCVTEQKMCKRIVNRVLHHKRTRNVHKDRLAEVRHLSKFMSLQSPFPKASLICLGRVVFTRREPRAGESLSVAECDGAVLFANGWNAKLWVFETKNGRGGSTQAGRDLDEMLGSKLSLSKNCSFGTRLDFGTHCAAQEIRLP